MDVSLGEKGKYIYIKREGERKRVSEGEREKKEKRD